MTYRIKALINYLVDKNKTNAEIAVGFVDPNEAQFYGHGKMFTKNKTMIDLNTIFAFGSTTKVFTTIFLADVVNVVNHVIVKLGDTV